MQIAPPSTVGAPHSVVVPAAPVPTDVIAHRGYHDGTTPYENTTDAFLRAIRLGADVMETDVRRTRDGVLVLHHDARIGAARISDTNFADLPKLPNGQPVSTLAGVVDAIAAAGGHTRLLIETKESGYEAEIVATARRRLDARSVEYMSFDQGSVRALRSAAPDSKVGVLFTSWLPDWASGTWPISGAAMVERVHQLGADFVAIDQRLANNARLDALAGAAISTRVWTVDDRADIQRLLKDPRVSGIITDTPDVALAMRRTDPSVAAAAAARRALAAIA